MSTCFFVVFTDGFPVVDVKDSLAHDFVGVPQSVDDELVGNVIAVVVSVIYTICVFARVDANEHSVPRIDDFTKAR